MKISEIKVNVKATFNTDKFLQDVKKEFGYNISDLECGINEGNTIWVESLMGKLEHFTTSDYIEISFDKNIEMASIEDQFEITD